MLYNKCVLAIGRYESGEARNEGKTQYFRKMVDILRNLTYYINKPKGFVWRHVKAVLRLGRVITETD